MKIPFLEDFRQFEELKDLRSKINEGQFENGRLLISAMPGSTRNLLAWSLYPQCGKIILLFPDKKNVDEAKVEFDILGLGQDTVSITEFNTDKLQEALTSLSKKEKFIFLSTYKILNIRVPSRRHLNKNTTTLQAGGDISYDELIEYLELIDYGKDKFVENPGDYAVRGSIIDFWSYSESRPGRVEFDGDFIESIRYFDPESQRSSNIVEQITIAAKLNSEDKERMSDIFDFIGNPLVFAGAFELESYFNIKKENKSGETPEDMEEELLEELYEGKKEKGVEEEKVETEEGIIPDLTLEDIYSKNGRWLIEQELDSDGRINLHLNEAPPINSNFEALFNVIKDYSAKHYKIILTAENEIQGKRLLELLSDFKKELAELIESGKVKINVLAIKAGYLYKKDKVLVLSDYQIFNKPYRTKLSRRHKIKKSRVRDFASLKHGDYVVHENYGIGRYSGLHTIKIGMVEQESIKILYAEGGIVYVNLNYLSLVKKYSTKDSDAPKLSVLGSNEWKNAKKKVKNKIKTAARELITLYAQRKAKKGFPFSPDNIWQKELEASFFYEDTPDQAKVTEQVKEDMESDSPMDRLVCGDVGFGKTEIAVRAAFKAINDNKQVGLLVPTTILAEQHYYTFKDRLAQFPVKVAVLSRFQSKSSQKQIVQDLAENKVDVIIGTHRLLSQDVKFQNLGLLIIDEEQRFGVMAKEKLRTTRANVDTLTLTATPIPRTLNLSLLGARDLSIIATPPPNRQPIYTKVEVFDIMKVREWVLEEIKRNGQIYFVHDRVRSIEMIAAYIQKHIPEINIGVAHGQMKPLQLEKVIHDFLNRKHHMLIATKIIESGLDIPNVNTIIINRADRFGLAELHQLRGRVGRSDRQAYAYLLVPSMNTITQKAVRRLQAIEEYTDLGEGFNLSMRDLEIRGAGNLLGTEQSGSIDAVGFDMYVKLLDEAVEELKKEEFSEIFDDLPVEVERTEPKIDTYFEIGIPQDYMPDQSDRLGFYTALFSMKKIDELGEIREEMEDRFGKAPVVVERMIETAVLRYYASYALFERIVIQRNRMAVILPKAENEEFYTNKFTVLMQFIVDNYSKTVSLKQEKNVMKFEIENKYSSPEDAVKFLVKFSQRIIHEVIFEKAKSPV